MYNLKIKYILITVLLIISLFNNNSTVIAEPVELPQITESPKLKQETLLKDLDIPSVRERDPDPKAGPRLFVSEFRLQGIVEYPELGITRAAISEIVENIRFDMMKEGKLLESGRTLEELGELSNLLISIEKEVEQEHVGPLEVQRLIWLVREQQQKRGVTLGMIETVADKITRYYREHGFILAKAYIPEQQVRDGVVTITLLLGVLGEVKVNDNENYNDEIISSVFDDMMTKPVTSNTIEEKLYLINDLPGISTQGFFEAGSQTGDTRLNVKVKSEEWYNANVRIDNHGSEDTGENRLYSNFIWNNPTGTADQVQLGILYASDPGSTLYGQLRYATNFFGPRFKIALGYTNNQFVLGDNNQVASLLELAGETNIKDISFSYKFKRSRKENYSLDLIYENIESIITAFGEPWGGLGDEVNNISLKFNYDILQEQNKMLHQGNFKLTQGDFLLGADLAQDTSYTVLKADYSLLSFWQIPFTEIETRSVVRASIQVADTSLSSINQFSLGGPSRARGFLSKEFSADSALYLGADWFLEVPDIFDFEMGDTSLGKVLTPFLFIDLAYGEANNPSIEEDIIEDGEVIRDASGNSTALSNVGFGFQFSYENNLGGNLQFAFPIGNNNSSNSSEATEDDEVKILLEMQYRF